MASLTQWPWVWTNSRRQWGTGKPGVLQSVGSHRVGHNRPAEGQQGVFRADLRSCLLSPIMHFIRLKSGTQEDALFAATGFVSLSKQSWGKHFYRARGECQGCCVGLGCWSQRGKIPHLLILLVAPTRGKGELWQRPSMKAACASINRHTACQQQRVFTPGQALRSSLSILGCLSDPNQRQQQAAFQYIKWTWNQKKKRKNTTRRMM